MHLMNNSPHHQIFQFTVEASDGSPDTMKVDMEPGEVVDLDDAIWERIEGDSRTQRALSDRRLIASIEPGSKEHKDTVHGIAHNKLSQRFIGELSKTARETDIEGDERTGADKEIIGQAQVDEARKFREKVQS